MFVLKPLEGAKTEIYPQILDQVKALIDGEADWIANLSNTSSLLYHLLKDVNWVGFYLYKENQLVLGPFHGKPACVRIPIGKGVCGTSAEKKETVIVADVHAFPGHIACDAASQSEIVVPIVVNGEIVGVLDIDSPIKDRFDVTDQHYLEEIVEALIAQSFRA